MNLSFPDLERRFFRKDVSWAEKERLLNAALRLREGQGGQPPTGSALGRFIDAARVILCRPDLVDPPLEGDPAELPLALRVPIAAMILEKRPITHEWLFSWWSCDGRKGSGSSELDREDEFRMLFALRFAKRFPRGQTLSAGTLPRLAPRYRAAADAFEAPVDLTPYGGPLCDISAAREPLATAREIAAETARALEPWRALLERSPDMKGSAEAHAILPGELRPFFPSHAAKDFTDWARARLADGGRATLEELIFRLRGSRPSHMARADLVALGESLVRLGLGLAPDARVSLRSPTLREPVVLFTTGDEVPGPPGRALRSGIERLTLAATIGTMTEATTAERGLRAVTEEARARLTGWERDLFDATRDWLSMIEPDLAPVRTLLRDGGREAEEEVRELIAAILGTDETATEVARRLGLAPIVPSMDKADTPPMGQDFPIREVLDPKPIPEVPSEPPYSNPVEAKPPAGEGTESADAAGGGFTQSPGPSGPGHAAPLRIDPQKWAEKRRETEEAQKVLRAALGETASPAPTPAETPPTPPLVPAPAQLADPPSTAASGRFRGLDASAARLAAELLRGGRWSELEFEALARRHRVMPDGIVEILNEWSIERFHEPIVEVYEGYVLSPSVVAKLNTET